MNIILLSGGSGTRLWPLSNSTMSKQFLRLLKNDKGDKESMVQRVNRQLKEASITGEIVIATGEQQVDSIKSQLGESYDIVLEPEHRNTYAAILLSSAYLKFKKRIDDNESVIVMPVDSYAEKAFFERLHKMDEVVQKKITDITLMGIEPTYPSEKYGYITCKKQKSSDDFFCVNSFYEKPNLQNAKRLLNEGAYWNSGVFAFKLGYIMSVLHDELGEISSYEDVMNRYSTIEKNSFDYEVVEKCKSISMIQYSGYWKDLGTWNTLTEEMSSNQIGNVITGEDTSGTSIVNVTDLPVIVLGIHDAVVAASADGILVTDKQKSSYLKPYVEKLNDRPMFEEKCWGKYRVIDTMECSSGNKALTKHLYLKKNKGIEYQTHKHRDEVLIIIDGIGEAIIDGKTFTVKQGDVIKILSGQKHSITAESDLHIIEVQMGDELIEEDIERIDSK